MMMTSRSSTLAASGPELGLDLWQRRTTPTDLRAVEAAELRRAIRRLRRFFQRRPGRARGTEARDAIGRPVDPIDPRARSFSVSGAFLAAALPSPWLYRAWMALAHQAAADLMGDPEADVFAYNDAPEIDQAGLVALLDEIEARLPRRHAVG